MELDRACRQLHVPTPTIVEVDQSLLPAEVARAVAPPGLPAGREVLQSLRSRARCGRGGRIWTASASAPLLPRAGTIPPVARRSTRPRALRVVVRCRDLRTGHRPLAGRRNAPRAAAATSNRAGSRDATPDACAMVPVLVAGWDGDRGRMPGAGAQEVGDEP